MTSLSLSSSPSGGAIDPVCGMTVQPASAAGSYTFEGKTYHCCSRHCLERLRSDPRHYLDKGPHHAEMTTPVPAPPGGKVEYICPMDPEVVSDRPGACPKCGMALEPRIVSADDAPTAEEFDLKRRFLIGLVLG